MNRPRKDVRPRSKASGAVLPITLVFILVVGILTAAMLRGGFTDDRVTGNDRTQQVAFQSAELGLRFCERVAVMREPAALFSRIYRGTNAAPSVKGYQDVLGRPFWAVAANWEYQAGMVPNGNVIVVPDAKGIGPVEAASAPRCFIEEIRMPSKTRDTNTGLPVRMHYRITSRGTGIEPATQITLQSEIRP